MAISGKYTIEERKLTRKIYKLKNHQRKLREKWLDDDIKIIVLKHLLKGKYSTNKKY